MYQFDYGGPAEPTAQDNPQDGKPDTPAEDQAAEDQVKGTE